jgi:hypothetical protein
VHFAGLKLFVDGAAGQGGAWTSWPNTLGLDMHYHVGGDKSIDAVLSAIEAVKAKKGSLTGKHTLYHLGLITDDQITRMKNLGSSVIAGVQPSLHWEAVRSLYHPKSARITSCDYILIIHIITESIKLNSFYVVSVEIRQKV